MRDYRFTNKFIKDLVLMEKRGIDLDKIYEVDVLLLYEFDEKRVTFSRLGTHSDLF